MKLSECCEAKPLIDSMGEVDGVCSACLEHSQFFTIDNATPVIYKDWKIFYWPKPGPMSDYDYDAVHDDFDGAPDGDDNRAFNAASLNECKQVIDNWETENG